MLAKALPSCSLEQLDISRNAIGNVGIQKLCHSLTFNQTSLFKLDISDCKFNFSGCKPLYEMIKKNRTIKYLVMDKNNLGGFNVGELKGALWANQAIEKLSMENCEL